jgi:mRNA-degrading endonuclease RelE of RelBE toxin-antitoxin system
MSYKIATIPQFDKDLKKLAKKYPSIKNDIATLAKELSETPDIGDAVFKNCYKVRMAITSKGKGKRAGAKVITYVLVLETTVLLLSIYDKSERTNISDGEIFALVANIGL